MKTEIRIDPSLIDILDAQSFVTDEACGAVASFVGVTRRDTVQNKQVQALEFETHVPLAKAVLEDIVDSFRTRNSELCHVYIHHRTGIVPTCQGNVVIAVSSGHRAPAFSAVVELMDLLKAKLPIWKKEIYTDGSYRWLENTEFSPG